MRKYDVEPIFGHLKNVFGMRRTHLRGKKKVETDIGIAFDDEFKQILEQKMVKRPIFFVQKSK